jgi:hypothetical protein
MLTNVASPGRIVHYLLSEHAIERLQDAVDKEVAENETVDLWPEHWDTARATQAWLCPQCSRLYIGLGSSGPVRVFTLERVGFESLLTGLDSQFGTETELLKLAAEQTGESPLTAEQSEPNRERR